MVRRVGELDGRVCGLGEGAGESCARTEDATAPRNPKARKIARRDARNCQDLVICTIPSSTEGRCGSSLSLRHYSMSYWMPGTVRRAALQVEMKARTTREV